MKVLISASLLSAMVFYSSLIPFLNSFNLYICSTIHKNYMFLLCNGLLIFIVRNSGLIDNPGAEPSRGIGRGEEAQEAAMGNVSSKVEDGEEIVNELIEKEEESERLIIEVEEEEEERYNFDDEDEDEDVEALSTEELNKKCEEFIRKMKAGIIFESQQLLVL